MRILLADDNPSSLEDLASFLREHTSATLVTCASVRAALDAAVESPPHVLITGATFRDLSDGDGFALRRSLEERIDGLRVAFTSVEPLDQSEEGHLDGAEVFYHPPLDGDRLLEWLSATTTGIDTRALETGTKIGDYELLEEMEVQDEVVVYEALQTTVDRKVALVLLRPSLTEDEDAVRRFRATVRAKASVIHPHIAPVYEAHEASGVVFYTREHIAGKSLAELAAEGIYLKQDALLQIARETSEAALYLTESQISTAPLSGKAIFLDKENETEIANLAVAEPSPDQSEADDLQNLGRSLAPLIDPTSLAHAEISTIIDLLGGRDPSTQKIARWIDLTKSIDTAQQRLSDAKSLQVPAAAKLPPWKRAELLQKRKRIIALIGIAAGAIALLLVISKLVTSEPVNIDDLEVMTRIPAGNFVYQDGEKLHLDTFYIDAHEVSIGQYAEFLDAAAADPSTAREFAHPDQPASKTNFIPMNWDELYDAAARGGKFEGQRVTLRCPVVFVDWWDAYAYASWKGRRLPSEQEWEKAARGKNGRLFPWGDHVSPESANTGEDHSANGSGGEVDGFNFWAPVDAHPEDTSEFSVHGMAGNVSEWTSSSTRHPTNPDATIPVVRGGSYATQGSSNADLTTRHAVNNRSERSATIGFRTAADRSPE